ncbi:MAG: long-chain fatty acid--CoA ligase, partial [Gammaproteobacteria bacterium]|nr:long-chain fatty acid--CoA ligase [Gammaproteobacteria bacterium]
MRDFCRANHAVGLTQGIHRALQLRPRSTALVAADRALTWSEFADRVARLAGGLLAHGMAPGDRVAMLAHNGPCYVEYYFAVLWAGGVIAPVNVRWSLAEQAHCLADSGAKILLADAAHWHQACELAAASALSCLIAVDVEEQ